MATLREYFDADFDYTVRVHITRVFDETLSLLGEDEICRQLFRAITLPQE
jgi:hypothetical protein